MRKLLFSNGSPYARRVRIVLAEKGLEYEADIVNAVRPIESIKAHNPALQVPTLYDRNGVIWGSNLILQYLFTAYPTTPSSEQSPPLAPTIARGDRYWDDMLTITTIESMTDSIINYYFLNAGSPGMKHAFLERQLARVASCLDWLELRCNVDGFWPGTFSVMDINLMCPLVFVETRKVFDYRTGQWPKITAMVDRCRNRPSVVATAIASK